MIVHATIRYAFCFNHSYAVTRNATYLLSVPGLNESSVYEIIFELIFPFNRSGFLNLQSINFPENSTLYSIGNRAFTGCTNLRSVHLPSSLRVIGSWAFAGCARLTSLTFADSLDYGDAGRTLAIESFAFGGYFSGDEYSIMATMVREGLEQSFFDDVNNMQLLDNVMLPPRTTQIGTGAFERCWVLRNLAIPSATLVSTGAFENSCDFEGDHHAPGVLLVNCESRWLTVNSSNFEMRNWVTNATPPTTIEMQSTVWFSPPSLAKSELFVNFVPPADVIRYEISAVSLQVGVGGQLQIDAVTGRVDANLTTPGVYSVDIDALDWSDRRTTAFTWSYTVVTFPPLVRSNAQLPFSPQLPAVVVVDEAVRLVATMNLQSLFTNSHGAITLALEDSSIDQRLRLAPGEALFAVTDSTDVGSAGQQMLTLVIVPSATGNFTVSLTGSDETGRRSTILTWRFEVEEDRPQLMLETNYGQLVPAGDSASALTYFNRTKWGWDTTYQLAPFNLTRAFTVYTNSGAREERNYNVTYSLDWGLENAPRGFFLDGSTGEALVKIPRELRNITARLMVGAAGTRSAVAANLTFELRPVDVDGDSDAVGPGGNGKRTDMSNGTSEFDGHFTCTCSSGFVGANCDDVASAQAASDSSKTTVAYSAIGVVAVLLLVAIATGRYQVRRNAALHALVGLPQAIISMHSLPYFAISALLVLLSKCFFESDVIRQAAWL
jgi:hypothetical protein